MLYDKSKIECRVENTITLSTDRARHKSCVWVRGIPNATGVSRLVYWL